MPSLSGRRGAPRLFAALAGLSATLSVAVPATAGTFAVAAPRALTPSVLPWSMATATARAKAKATVTAVAATLAGESPTTTTPTTTAPTATTSPATGTTATTTTTTTTTTPSTTTAGAGTTSPTPGTPTTITGPTTTPEATTTPTTATATTPATSPVTRKHRTTRHRKRSGTAAPSSAQGFYIAGAGDGHGIGMSQYGALGFAQHGFTADQILAHYYAGTSIGTVSPHQPVTVLLRNGPASFSGADRANGHHLDPTATYTVAVAGSNLTLSSGGQTVLTAPAPLTVSGSGPLQLVGLGLYRGSFVFRPGAGHQILTVDQVQLEDYVRGVVSAEMPSSWPLPALEAQAIAARTYVLTAAAPNADFQVYDDTRSQMYGGVKAETPSTDAAVAATTGQVVEYDGTPATTYFFASSGGYTEDIQNVWVGVSPEAWLQGVVDPYDDSGGNPFYRWKVQMSLARAQRRLRGFVKGSLVGIRVVKHGVSPRVVIAAVVGTRGTTTVTGVQLEQSLGLISTYLKFTTITVTGTTTSGSVTTPAGRPVTAVTPAPSTPSSGTTTIGPSTASSPRSSTGGAGIPATSDLRRRAGGGARVSGSVFPARAGETVVVERLGRHGFFAVARGRTAAGGGYAIRVPGAGRYRVSVGGTAGPVVTVA